MIQSETIRQTNQKLTKGSNQKHPVESETATRARSETLEASIRNWADPNQKLEAAQSETNT